MAGIYLYGDNQDLYLQALTLAKKLSFEAGEPVCALALHGREDGFNYGEVNELIVLESADAMPENYAKAVVELLDEAKSIDFIQAVGEYRSHPQLLVPDRARVTSDACQRSFTCCTQVPCLSCYCRYRTE